MISVPEHSIHSSSAEPQINQYSRKKRSPLRLKILFGGVILIVLGLLFFKLQGLFKDGQEEKNYDGRLADITNVSSRRRQDLSDVLNTPVITPNLPQDVVDSPQIPVKPLPKMNHIFKKYRSIPVQSSAQSAGIAQTAVGQEPVKKNAVVASIEEVKPPGMKVEAITLDPNLFIEENTYIPCTLQTRFVSDVAGRISCVLSQDVYSANSHTKLIEKGTKAFGVYRTGTLKHGEGRMFVIWTQLRTPDFKKISLVDTQVVGQLGEAGIDGWIDTKFWKRFGNALMLSLVQDVAAAAAKTSGRKDRSVDYTENSRESIAKMANTALENSINIPPTMYKNQGEIIGILVGEDIDFSAVYALRRAKQ